MRRTHRLSARLIRWISLSVCFVLILSSLLTVPLQLAKGQGLPTMQGRRRQSSNGSDKGRKVRPAAPQAGAPAASLPDLDEVRQRRSDVPRAPRQIESTMRSRRKPLESRQGRKVGDPLPRKQSASANEIGNGGERVRIAGAYERGLVGTAKSHNARTTRSLPTGVRGSSSLAKPLSLIAVTHGLSNHSNLDFLRYPSLHSDPRVRAIAEWHSDVGSNGNATFSSAEKVSTARFDFFVPLMPQSGSSRLVFASNRDGSPQIYVMNSDGTVQTRLTYSGANDDYPRWSPNGVKILFQSDRDNPSTGYMDIYVMNADGSGVTRLTSDPNDDSMATWSADGTKIVFQSMRNGVNYQVYSMNADGSTQVNLTNTSASDGEPSWSPDGTKIAFASDRDHSGYDSVYVMNSNGSNQHRLTFSASTVDDRQPVWSRDGSKIAFVSTRDSVLETWQETADDGTVIGKSKLHINKEIYVMNADGSGQTRLTSDLANDDSPSWSPDGSKIVFRSDRERNCCDPSAQVWTMNANGSSQTIVSTDQSGNYSASWTTGSVNQPPIANAGGAYSGVIGQNAAFNGGGSFDPDGAVVSYSWTFGDGGTASGLGPTHAYGAAGTYNITLTVTDNLGAQGSASTTISISSSSSDQFAQNFLLSGLGHPLEGDEASYWTDIMRSAYPQGQSSMLIAMTEFGMTVFESAEYAGRSRSDHDYVYDLYKTYLMRDPEPCNPSNDPNCGWNYWTDQASPLHMGRENVRNAFEESGEFYRIVAALTASGAPSSAVASLATARVDPFNQTGNQLQARDCEWSVPLLSLPGRAGLDLGLGLSYSSLVWTHSGPYVYLNYDEDDASPSMGFHLGFATIQSRSFDAQISRNVYVLTTSSGRRVELRQVGNSNFYEAGDSSYLQLIDYSGSLLVRTTDGTQMSYGRSANVWQATKIKDRNGNFISANYNGRGDLQNITDTLGRVINFIYDGNANLISITQNGRTNPWVTFGWSTTPMHPAFGSAEVVGTHDGETIPTLAMVGFPDGSYDKFSYNGNGQMSTVTHYASDSNPLSDNHPLNHTTYVYDSPSNDCPRITEAHVGAENWTGTEAVPAAEVITHFSDPGDGSHVVTTPDGTIYKDFYGSGWQHGLVTSTQVLTGATQQKLTSTSWIQDNPSVNYQTNPRVIRTDVIDSASNHSRTDIGYYTFTMPVSGASCSLPSDIYEYEANATTVARRTHTDYNLDATNYLSRRIVGLPAVKYLCDGAQGLVPCGDSSGSSLFAKSSYQYDEGSVSYQGSPIQHDESNYGSGLVIGRGNLTSMRRYDVTNLSQFTATTATYNSSGSVITATDAANHQTSIAYTDAFSPDGTSSTTLSFVTLAYPTTVTDADGYSTSLKYNYEFGAKTLVQTPQPNTTANVAGPVQTFAYDNAARLQRVTNLVNNGYTHYEYGPNYARQYSTVNNVSTDPHAADSYSVQFFDGAGRVFEGATYHPGSQGGYSAVYSVFDAMGRIVKQSNPTETNGSWVPTGDDAAGWIFTQQTYDWKGRPLITTNPDGWQKSTTYSACGCAGSEATTVMDEAGRRRRSTNDVLGRLAKVEELNWDGSVYSTANYAYNALDQLTSVNHEGQVRTLAYDGYGRLQSRTTPEQSTTTYAYNPDDTTNSVNDARGATATYAYNNRHLVTGINYTAPSGVAATPNVTFGYDAAGNRTSMNDGLGAVSYGYDQLSQLTSEARTFNGVGSFTLSYGYNLVGEVTGVTNPWNVQIGYGYDNSGRLTSVTGSGYANISTYASDINYRAWGGLKSMSYRDGHTLSTTYDNRMRPITWNVSDVLGYNYAYDYYNEHTGRATYAQNIYDSTLDRSYQYDQVGALVIAHSGAEARASAFSGQWGIMDGPYSLGFDYDKFGNMTHRYGWGGEVQGGGAGQTSDIHYSYTNNKRNDFGYDAAGNLTNDLAQSYTYDATGQQATASASSYFLQQNYDGDGLRIQKTENGAVTYYVRSSVLGGTVVAETNGNGGWQRGYVYAGGDLLAVQQGGVYWVHEDPVTKSKRVTDIDGNIVSTVELDPWGAGTNRSSNSAFLPQNFTSYIRDANGGQDAMARRYSVVGRFSQPDPFGGSYDFSDPQSLNRYAYTKNDPVNFRDPSGLDICTDEHGKPVPCPTWNPEEIISIYTHGSPWRDLPRLGDSGLFLPVISTGEGPIDPGNLGPQKPPQTKSPANSQQKGFDNCAKTAMRAYRKTYLKTSAKAIVGGAGVGVGLAIGGVGFRLAGHALQDAGLPILTRLGTAAFDFSHIGMIGLVPYIFGGQMALDSISEANQNSNRTEAALEDCRRRYPNANHRFADLNF